MTEPTEPIFSYGTLQDAAVQQEQFGRLLDGSADSVAGWRIGLIRISDPDVVRQSGLTHHKALVADADAAAIDGMVYWLTRDELAAADEYESGEYERRRVTLGSGQSAWIYVAAPGLELEQDHG